MVLRQLIICLISFPVSHLLKFNMAIYPSFFNFSPTVALYKNFYMTSICILVKKIDLSSISML